MRKNGVAITSLALIVVLVAVSWIHLLRAAPEENLVMAIIEDTHGDRIGVEPTSSDVWDELIELYHNKEEMFIGGPVEVFVFIRPDPNYPWGFRFKPENIIIAENIAEGLQTTIRGISEDVDYWIKFGPAYVLAKVVEIHERGETSDITGPDGFPDGKVDIRDIGFAALNFGRTVPPAPSACDITGLRIGIPDGTIDMRDVGTIARHFGKLANDSVSAVLSSASININWAFFPRKNKVIS